MLFFNNPIISLYKVAPNSFIHSLSFNLINPLSSWDLFLVSDNLLSKKLGCIIFDSIISSFFFFSELSKTFSSFSLKETSFSYLLFYY